MLLYEQRFLSVIRFCTIGYYYFTILFENNYLYDKDKNVAKYKSYYDVEMNTYESEEQFGPTTLFVRTYVR